MLRLGGENMYFYGRYFINETITFFNGDTIRSIEGFYITIDEEIGVARLEVEGPKDSNPNVYSGTGLIYTEEIPLSGRGIFKATYIDNEPIHFGDVEDRGNPV